MHLPTGFVTHHDCSRHDTGWQHPEHQGRLPAVARAVYREMLSFHEVLREIEGVPLDEKALLLAHSSEYVARVRDAVAAADAAGEPVEFESGTRISAASWDAATAAAGCVVTAVDAVLDGRVANAFCSVRPPGSGAGRGAARYHAVFNNVALAALHLRRRGVGSVLIVEWGEHFGTGTAELPASDPGIGYLSLHAAAPDAPHPGDGVVAVRMVPGAKVEHLLHALDVAWSSHAATWRPEFVVLSLGMDVLASDPLGSMALEPPDLGVLTRRVMEMAGGTAAGRLVSVLEGGYDAAASATAVVHHLRALADMPG